MSDEPIEGEIIDGEVVVGTEMVPVPEVAREEGVTLFGTSNPVEVIERASAIAGSLAQIIADRKLYADIKGRRHVLVEGWTMLGSMLGVFPVLEEIKHVEIDGVGGWEATVNAQTRHGEIIGRASALCMRNEGQWRMRDEYALQSMAQTRATGKALRLPLGFVMQIAGYDATPAEEMRAAAKQEVAIEKVSPETLTMLLDTLVIAREIDPDLWADLNVLKSARRRFGRSGIDTLSDLTETEATTVVQGAMAWINTQHEGVEA
jgi:hypothetical protein